MAEKRTKEELEEGKAKLNKLSEAEIKKREEEKKKRAEELEKIRKAMEEAEKKGAA